MALNFGKYVDTNTIIRPRKHLRTPHLVAFNFNENEALLRQEGYYPLVETNKPEDVEDEEHIARATYELVEDKHTENVEKPAVLVDEDGTEHETTVQEEVEVDNSYINVTYVAEDKPEETEE